MSIRTKTQFAWTGATVWKPISCVIPAMAALFIAACGSEAGSQPTAGHSVSLQQPAPAIQQSGNGAVVGAQRACSPEPCIDLPGLQITIYVTNARATTPPDGSLLLKIWYRFVPYSTSTRTYDLSQVGQNYGDYVKVVDRTIGMQLGAASFWQFGRPPAYEAACLGYPDHGMGDYPTIAAGPGYSLPKPVCYALEGRGAKPTDAFVVQVTDWAWGPTGLNSAQIVVPQQFVKVE